jgi:carbamoyltransferase
VKILGISAFYHDSATCLLVDGVLVAAAQEERFTRKRHDKSFPIKSIDFCIRAGKLHPSEIDFIVFYEKPFIKFERILETYLAFAPYGFQSFLTSFPSWIKEKLFQKKLIQDYLAPIFGEAFIKQKLLFSDHHLSHAASAFYPSPFKDAAILTMDGVGEWATTSVSIGSGNALSIHRQLNFPHSLGLLYSAFTYYLGFKVDSGEYKVMGLAPYGRPIYSDLIKSNLIRIQDDGSFMLDMDYFNYCTGLTMTSDKFNQLFGGPPRLPESSLSQRDMDLAASIQAVTEEVVIKLAKGISQNYPQINNLCLAGGVALNCVANGKLLREKIFKNIWVQPASGDAGGAIGAAFSAYHLMHDHPRVLMDQFDGMNGAFLGPEYTDAEIKAKLEKMGANFSYHEEDELINIAAQYLDSGGSIGWFQGRMEFGPRALGARSIIADPRNPLMQKELNLQIKFRESFRPFAPSVIREDLVEWFHMDIDSPYMTFIAQLQESKLDFSVQISDYSPPALQARSMIPAVTHIDNSARVQTVHKETNLRFYRLLKKFKELTSCPVLVNTSFNVRGEPIVCSPEDAFRCFMGTNIKMLIIGSFVLYKGLQNPSLVQRYDGLYELD